MWAWATVSHALWPQQATLNVGGCEGGGQESSSVCSGTSLTTYPGASTVQCALGGCLWAPQCPQIAMRPWASHFSALERPFLSVKVHTTHPTHHSELPL